MIRHPLQYVFDDPAIDHRHAVVGFRGENELARRHQVAEFVAHRQQNFVVAGRAVRCERHRRNALTIQNQAAVVNRLVELGHPFHYTATPHHARITKFVFLNAVAARVLRRVTRFVGRAHRSVGIRRTFVDEHDADARRQRVVAIFPIETLLADELQQPLRDLAGGFGLPCR